MSRWWAASIVCGMWASVARADDPPRPYDRDCHDTRLAKLRHNTLKLTSQVPGVTVRIQWKMKIAGHEECGTVTTPWEGALPAGGYNLMVYDGDQVVAQLGVSLVGRRAKATVVDVSPRPAP